MTSSQSPVELLLSKLEGVRHQGAGWGAKCPSHNDTHQSLSVNETTDGRALLKCHADANCTAATIVKSIGLELRDLFPQSPERITLPKSRQHIWRLPLSNGQVAEHHRVDRPNGKKVWWTLDGTKGLDGRSVCELPLYGTDKLAAGPVVVTEGEKACDALLDHGVQAVGTVTGAATTPSDDSLLILRGHDVTLWPDNDGAGVAHMQAIVTRLAELGVPVRRLEWPDAPDKGDAADAIAMGVDVGALIAAALTWEPPTAGDGAMLLDEVAAFYRRFVVLTPAQGDTLALWSMHSHAIEAAEATLYLHVTSAERESGKTRTAEVAGVLVAAPLAAESISPAALARSVDKGVTVLLDEIDTVFHRGGAASENVEMLRGVLDSGWRRGGSYVRMVGPSTASEPRAFQTFGAKMLIGIGEIPGTLGSRSVRIELKRRRRDTEPVEPFRIRKATPEGYALRDRLSAWALAHLHQLRDAEPRVLKELRDRMWDSWEPLMAIADLAGGDWPQRARNAAKELCARQHEESVSLGVRLLDDLKNRVFPIFSDNEPPIRTGEHERLTTVAVVQALSAIEGAPWAEMPGRGRDRRAIDASSLARLLKPFGVGSQQFKEAGANLRGYTAISLADAWARYPLESLSSDIEPATRYLPDDDVLEGVAPPFPEITLPLPLPGHDGHEGSGGDGQVVEQGVDGICEITGKLCATCAPAMRCKAGETIGPLLSAALALGGIVSEVRQEAPRATPVEAQALPSNRASSP